MTAFNRSTTAEQLSLRAVVDYWWAPFGDSKRDEPALPIGRAPWVRLHLGYLCTENTTSGEASIQTNLVRPFTMHCGSCGVLVATSAEAPMMRLLV